MTRTSDAERRKQLQQQYLELWSKYSALKHIKSTDAPVDRCADDCPACPPAFALSALMRSKADEVRQVERHILDGHRPRGNSKRCSDLDIALTFMNPRFKTDEQRAASVHLSASGFAKRKAKLPPELAAMIAG